MPEPVRIDVKDTRGNPLRHKYLRQTGEARGIFYQLPGDNYGVDGPLLYFPSRMLFSAGWDTFSLNYGYQSAGESFSPTHIPEIVEECGAALETVLKQREYTKVVLAGKSLGAAIVAVLLTLGLDLEHARAVYLTPPLDTPVFDPVFVETENESYLALGTADRFYDEKKFNELLSEKRFEYTLIPDADHSVYIEGKLEATLQAHEDITRAVVDFAQA
jgi:acetyl esterase/lipase